MATKKPVVKKPAEKSTVFDELTAASGTTPNEGEPFQEFAVRIGVVLSELDDESYGKLSPAAVKWFTAATDAINADKEAPELPGYPEEAAAEPEAEPESAPEKPKVAAKKDKPKPAVKKEEVKPEVKSKGKEMAKKVVAKKSNGMKPAVKKDVKPKAEKKERAVRTDSVAYKLRVVGVKKPDITFEDACKAVGIKPEEGGHAWNVWYLTKLTMQVVKEHYKI